MNNDVKTVTELVQKAVEMGFYVVDPKDPTNANKVVYCIDGSNILPAAPPAPPLSGQMLPAPATQEILGNFCSLLVILMYIRLYPRCLNVPVTAAHVWCGSHRWWTYLQTFCLQSKFAESLHSNSLLHHCLCSRLARGASWVPLVTLGASWTRLGPPGCLLGAPGCLQRTLRVATCICQLAE